MGGQVGGFHNSLSEYLITYDGVINENYFKIDARESELMNNLEISQCQVKNPMTNEIEYFLGLLIKSKYDGTPGIREPVDVCISLDISGSMSCGIGEEQKDAKTRNDLSVEAIVKLVQQLNDDDGIAINTFDEQSHSIVPFRLKKKKKKKNIDDIKKIKPFGNENIYNALKGAMEQLLESTKKNKRIILITDLWAHDSDLKDFENLFKKCVHEEQIEITIIGISQDANSHLAEIVSYDRGCNYFNVLSSNDLNKYLVQNFNYMCFPYSYNINLKYKSNNLKVVKCIGAGEKEINGNEVNICNISCAIPSPLKIINNEIFMEGGLILLKLQKQNESKEKYSCELILDYEDRNCKKYEQKYQCFVNDEYTSDYFSSKGIEHGMSLYYYTFLCRNLLNYKNAYNENQFLNLDSRHTEESKKKWNNDRAKFEKYHDNNLIKKVLDFMNNHYYVKEGVPNHLERYTDKIYQASELDTPKRYQGE